jgi:hypothetical protein
VKLLVLVAALVVVPASLASHPSGPYVTRWANLDGDRAKERAVGWLDVDSRHTYSNWSVTIEDRCHGRWNRHKVSGVWDGKLETLRVPEADGVTRRREVFYRLRSKPAEGEAAIVRLDRRSPCPAPRFLFHYVARDPDLLRFDVDLGDFDDRHPGLEVRLTELSLGQDRINYYRYDRRAGRYVVYRSIPA